MRKIFHLHLPKTGGMALQAFLTEQLGKERVSPPLGGIRLADALLQWHDTQVISGHFAARQGDILPRDRLCMTVLRDPLERFVSEFSYNKHDVDSYLLDAKRFTHDLDEYCEALAFVPAEASSVQLGMLYPLGTDAQTRLTTDEKLLAARRALDQFELVGVTEELDDFTAMLSAVMGWPPQPLGQVNVTSKRVAVENLSKIQRAAIRRLIEPEVELYQHALSRFRRDRRQCIGGWHVANVTDPSFGECETKRVNEGDQLIEPKNFGDMRCEITGVSVAGSISGYQQVMAGELMNVIVEFVAHQPIGQLNVGIAIKDERGMVMYGSNTLLHGSLYALGSGRYATIFTMLNRLGPGRYQVDASLMPGESHYDDCYHWWEQATSFVVEAYAVQHYEGRVLMDAEIWFDGTSLGAVWERHSIRPPGIFARSFGRLNDPLQEFIAAIEPMVQVDVLPAAVDSLLQLKLMNNSAETWVSSGRNPVHLSYRWRLPESGEIVVTDGLRTTLREDVPPGASQISALQVRTPKETGSYLLEISLVQEQVAWFCDRQASSACYLSIEVR